MFGVDHLVGIAPGAFDLELHPAGNSRSVAGTGIQMLAFYLRKQCLEQAVETDGKYHIRRKVLQPEIASLLNMSREHVTRLFARLQEKGVVDFNRGYPIVDKHWLQSVVTDTDLADSIVYRDYPQ